MKSTMTKKVPILTLILLVIFSSCKKDKENVPPIGTISSLNCDNAKINGVLSDTTTEITQGVVVSNLELSIDYTGGNSGSYSEISISSSGVSGLVASAPANNLVNGNGTLILKVNGTATSNGQAIFDITLGGKSCSIKVKVRPATVQATMTSNSFTSSSSGNFGYWLYTPKNPNANMPLIVYFHGGSFRGSDINLLLGGSLPKFLSDTTVKDIPAYILMPQCPTGKTWEQITTPIIELIDNIVLSKSINSNTLLVRLAPNDNGEPNGLRFVK